MTATSFNPMTLSSPRCHSQERNDSGGDALWHIGNHNHNKAVDQRVDDVIATATADADSEQDQSHCNRQDGNDADEDAHFTLKGCLAGLRAVCQRSDTPDKRVVTRTND